MPQNPMSSDLNFEIVLMIKVLILVVLQTLAIQVYGGLSYNVCEDPIGKLRPECIGTEWLCTHEKCYLCHENGWCCDNDVWGPDRVCYNCDLNRTCIKSDAYSSTICVLPYPGAKCVPIIDKPAKKVSGPTGW